MQANFNPNYCFNKLNTSKTEKKIVNSDSNVKKPLLTGEDKTNYKTMNNTD
jgi:hypothetical protein